MPVYLRLVSRLLILSILVLVVVLSQPKAAFAGCFACQAQCRSIERDCSAGCIDPGCDAGCAADYDACVQSCGC